MKRTKRWFAGLLSVVLILTLLPVTALAAEQQSWAQSAVDTLNRIYDGSVFSTDETAMTEGDAYTVLSSMGCTSDKVTEKSDENLTRSDACDVLAEVFNLPVESSSSAIQYLYDQNMINGVSSNNLDGDGTVSKAQFAVLTYRVLNAVGGGLGSSVDDLKPGTDEYFSWMYLAARKCVDFSSEAVDGDITCGEWHTWISTLNASSPTLDCDCTCGEDCACTGDSEEGCGCENCTCTSDTCGCPCCNGEITTKLEAAVYLVKTVLQANSIFSDVPASSPYYDGVMYLFDHGIVSGQGDGTFSPETALPRFQLAVLLARLDNKTFTTTDSSDKTYTLRESINYAVDQGYMSGTAVENSWSPNDTTWGSNSTTTREEAIIALMKQQKVNVSNVNTDILDRFTGSSVSSTLDNADKYIAYAVSIGLVKGTSDGGLGLSEGTTRGVFGVLLYRTLIGVDKTKMQDYAENVAYAKDGGASMAMFFALPDEDMDIMPLANTETTLTLREDWRLTSDLDLAVSEGETLTINGNGHHIYEMGGKLTNSGLGVVQFSDNTCLYPAPSDTEGVVAEPWGNAASDSVMLARQPHSITVSTADNGSIAVMESKTSAKKGDTVTLTVTPNDGYKLSTLTVTATESSDTVTVTDNSFTMPASDVTIAATFQEESTPTTEYMIHFDVNGGSGTVADQTTQDGKLASLPTASRINYSFLGWFTAASGGEQVTTSTVFSNESTVYAQWRYNGGSSGGGSSSGGSSSSSSNTTTTTTKNDDGSTTTTVTNKTTGTVTETTKNPDGSTLAVVTEKDGTVTTTETRADGVKVKTVDEPGEDVTATVTIPRSVGEATVTIPANVDYGMVAVDANTGEIVKLSVPTEDGMTVKLDGSADLVLVDNAKDFTDTRNHWAEDAIDFATAHELFAGTSETTFTPDSPMTRAMLMTVLARFDGEDTTGGSVWYERGMAWAVANGVSDGSNPNASITREQFATMLWRYMGGPAASGSLTRFTDHASVSSYAIDAMRWAVSNGIINGMGDGTLAPQGNATRAQVATMLMRFVENLTK